MARTEAASSSPSLKSVGLADPIERVGALAKWVSAKSEEMAQLDARIERRLEHLQRTEESLRSVFEALRQQVTAAHAVASDMKQQTAAVQSAAAEAQSAAQATSRAAPSVSESVLAAIESRLAAFEEGLENRLVAKASETDQKLTLAVDCVTAGALEKAQELAQSLESRARELEQYADSITEDAAGRLAAVSKQFESARSEAAVEQWRQDAYQPTANALAEISADFERRSAAVVEAARHAAVDQIERLSTQASLAVDPILARIQRQRETVQKQLHSTLEAAEAAMHKRAEELARAGDATVDAVEQRLARRMLSARPRTAEALEATERSFNQRLEAILDGARRTVASAEEDLTRRVTQLQPRLGEKLQVVQDDLVEQLARMEGHVFSMTGWLEQRMAERIDALIAKTRSDLSSPSLVSPHSATDLKLALYADEYAAAPTPAPSVQVDIFVESRRADRPVRAA